MNTEGICVILPALDEADALPIALRDRPDGVRVIVVDNGSTDATADVAANAGVEVVKEPQRGFGSACWAGVKAADNADVVVFMDADATCSWQDLPALVDPIYRGQADLVLGRRVKALREPGSMPWHVSIGNYVLGFMCGRIAGVRVHDSPPFRAVRRDSLDDLRLIDRTYGWPLEMIIRAGHANLRICEVPVSYKRRVGRSKVTGTLGGTLATIWRMLQVIWRLRNP